MALTAELTAKEFADLIGISTRQVDNLVVEGLPRVKRPKRFMYPAAKCVRWYLEWKLERAKREKAPAPSSNAKDRKMLAEAKLAELDVAVREGALIALETVEGELAGILQRIRARLLAAPQKFAPRLVGLRSIPETLVALEPCIAELMTECTRLADDVEAGEHVSAAQAHATATNRPRRARRAS